MRVTCKSFADNEFIPKKHTGFGEDVSPELVIADAPDLTKTFAVILDDLDVPWKKDYNHWIIWNIPKTDVIPEGLPKGVTINEPVTACQGIAWGKNVYRGPKPPFFLKKVHRYVFYVFALDSELELSGKADKKALMAAMEEHVLAEAKITGLYQNV